MRFVRLAIVLFWVVLVGSLARERFVAPTVEAGPETSEAAAEVSVPVRIPGTKWMGVYIEDQKIGYTSEHFEKIDSGYRFEQASLLRLTVMDTPQVVRVRITGSTGPEYTLRDFTASLKSGFGTFEARGQVENSKLHMVVSAGGSETRQEIALKEPIRLAGGLRQVLSQRKLRPGLEVSGQVFDPATMQYRPMRVRVDEREQIRVHGRNLAAWRVREEFHGIKTTAWIDSAGETLREEGPMGMLSLRETGKQAVTEGWKEGVPFDLMNAVAVPVNHPIANPRKLRHLEVRLTGIPDVRVPEDGRQHFRGDTLVIESKRPRADETYALPYAGKQWRPELATDTFLQINHPSVRDAARRALGNEHDAQRAVEGIRRWVFGYLEKKPTISIPNALQVLKMKAGDCNEHSVLFAALARASGVPTRIVSGAVYANGAFLYHAWNEVWLGSRWISVDATFDQMPADATHLKFVEGGPANDDAILRVIGRLGIDVIVPG